MCYSLSITKADPDDPDDYRDETPPGCMGKLFDKIQYIRIVKLINDKNILREERADFVSVLFHFISDDDD